MKKLILSLVAIATISLSSFGQSPEGFKYQAVVRDAGNLILNNQAVGMRLTIQQGSIGGTAVYTETFAPTTNAYGLVNLEIGTGTTTDDFTIIDWANGPYFMETAADVSGGVSYVVMGTSQLMSVPYALYAKTSGNGQGPAGTNGIDGAAGIQGIQGLPGNNGINGIDGQNGAQGATGPQGLTGVQGPTGTNGIDGLDGAAGTQGIQGLQGNDGVDGIDGATGPAGTNGTNGAQGPIGLTGPAGVAGAAGADGTNGTDGATGPQGLTGAAGATGLQGAQGLPGTDGVDGLDGATGLQGTQGIQGLPGNDGVNGQDGATGPQGPIGVTGSNGTNGVDGQDGSNGLQGAQGLPGTDGIDGLDGAAGVQGIPGNNGVVDYDSLATIISADSSFTASVIGGIGSGGCGFKYPDGLDGESITHQLSDGNQNTYPYTVPLGKTFYVLSAYSTGSISITNESNIPFMALASNQFGGTSEARKSLINPIILFEGQTISGYNNSNGSTAINGMLVDKGVDPISKTGPYLVPSGKLLVITNILGGNSSAYFFIDGIKMATFAGSAYLIGQPIIVKENQLVDIGNYGIINGYLVDEDYFANCGAGQNNVNVFGSTSPTNVSDYQVCSSVVEVNSFITLGYVPLGGCTISESRGGTGGNTSSFNFRQAVVLYPGSPILLDYYLATSETDVLNQLALGYQPYGAACISESRGGTGGSNWTFNFRQAMVKYAP